MAEVGDRYTPQTVRSDLTLRQIRMYTPPTINGCQRTLDVVHWIVQMIFIYVYIAEHKNVIQNILRVSLDAGANFSKTTHSASSKSHNERVQVTRTEEKHEHGWMYDVQSLK